MRVEHNNFDNFLGGGGSGFPILDFSFSFSVALNALLPFKDNKECLKCIHGASW